LLVELALERLPADRPVAVADLGTGSGAIALALAVERPQAHIVATDQSLAALIVARRNARRLNSHTLNSGKATGANRWRRMLRSDRVQSALCRRH
jgi:methylase of polypeptide subunit release factors